MLRLRCFLALALFAGAVADDKPSILELWGSGSKAYAEKDYAGYLRSMQQAETLAPNNPGVAWHLARGYARTGNVGAAIASLHRLADLEGYYNAQASPDFDQIKDRADFKKVVARLEALRRRVGVSEVGLDVPGVGIRTESLAYDPRDKAFFLIGGGKIVRIAADRSVRQTPVPDAGLWSVLGIKFDPKHRELWANSCHFPPAPGGASTFDPATVGSAAIFRFHADTGKLIAKYPVADPKNPGCVNDAALDRNGDAYITMTPDGAASHVLKVSRATGKVEVFAKADRSLLANGIAVSVDERALYVADTARGVVRIDVTDRNWRLLDLPRNVALTSIDGMYVHDGALIVIQNSPPLTRIARVHLSKDGKQVTRVETLERNHPQFGYPLTGVIADGTLYYTVNPPGGRPEGEEGADPVVFRLKL